ncbi:hypothetical protein L7H23_01240 [Sphingopyxis sp. BSN-002]|uniref:hypothetical protein n=1 Tax=Sphingopyxis sp. BSN-002 TaxID=2911495 RepID=UPI001EDC60D8|nr:hypothetical protein [Sphingopyxis sp. BSN-002]QVJ07697.1 DNA/protein translocase [Sphingopyxis phage VSN-002]UKK84757.1 hypothetical protein L7H23_01240 [Sphingopyxis sp. BSN-002]
MVSPIDQGAILRSGAALIPDLAQQMLQQRQVAVQEQGLGLEQQKFAAAMAADQRERAQADAYTADVAMIGKLPASQQPQAIIALMQKYPQRSEALKRSYDAQDSAVRAADLREAGELYSLVHSGNPAMAAERLRKRIEADKQAGQDTSDDEAIAAALESGDPAKIDEAAAQIGMTISIATGPDKFASTYGALNPDQTEFEKQYAFIKQTYGQDAADTFAQNKYDPLTPITNQFGTSVYRSSQLAPGSSPNTGTPAPTNGGGNAPGGKGAPVADAKAIAHSLFPNVAVTSQHRDPNSPLGKANPNSWHNKGGAAIDVKPIPGMKFSDYIKKYRDAGYTILEARNEVGEGRSKWATGDHWHVVLGGGPASATKREINGKKYVKRGSDWYEVK